MDVLSTLKVQISQYNISSHFIALFYPTLISSGFRSTKLLKLKYQRFPNYVNGCDAYHRADVSIVAIGAREKAIESGRIIIKGKLEALQNRTQSNSL